MAKDHTFFDFYAQLELNDRKAAALDWLEAHTFAPFSYSDSPLRWFTMWWAPGGMRVFSTLLEAVEAVMRDEQGE